MARRASFTSPEDGGRHASFTGISRPDMADVDLFSDVDDDELRALGLPTTTWTPPPQPPHTAPLVVNFEHHMRARTNYLAC